MKEIKSYYMITVYLLAGLICLAAAALMFLYFDGIIFIVLAGALLGGGMCCFMAVRSFVNNIEIDKESIYVKDFPFLGAKKTLKNEQLKALNSSISLSQIENAKIVYLTKEQKRQYVGQRHIFNKYIEFKLKNSDESRYVYVSMYSKKQINDLIDIAIQKKYN